MDISNLKSMIRKNIVDFSELVLNNYQNIGLDEVDAIIIIKLNYLLNRNITFIHPQKLSNMLSISAQTTTKRINNLIDAGYITMELVKNDHGKETESFNLDNVIERIMKADFEDKMLHAKEDNVESRLVQLFESEFRKPLSVLDIQTITKWLNDDHYTYEEIKNALFEASKARKHSIKYVDGILLQQTAEEPQQKYNQTTLIKDLKKIWTE
ncbi:DnaD domain-containing protein [Candidatus Xianfuyuplasma coldseepsis]|uniref:DnaD domain protein n=1 Tax=Candidatus Xianfuyuplasma coldseepsis TaxID=2782163 RepID=A0A7L7KT64_9MOLU|nr:DnaD domain protein [Xianfuyuplasma coldseepsis]QMS85589.1 DnaD domain protein [Xianfuyuplasma coldseepsis]